MTRRIRRLAGLLLLAAPASLLALDYAMEFVAIDRCLDGGGVYDYVQECCRHDQVHLPSVAYWQRRGPLVALGGVATALGVWLLLSGRRGVQT